MRVLHLTSGSLDSGASKGAYRLHQGLLELEIDSYIAGVAPKGSSFESIIDLNSIAYKTKKALNGLWNRFLISRYSRRPGFLFSCGSEIFDSYPDLGFETYDIIHLHWINYSLSLDAIRALSNKHRVIWTMRDMWPFTGGCHYSLDCSKYTTGCGACPQLSSSDPCDVSHRVVDQKKTCYQAIQFVAVSDWQRKEALKSGLFRQNQVAVIHNSVDTKVFHPTLCSEGLRQKHKIDTDKPILLIGAQDVSHPYKGSTMIRQIIERYGAEFFFVLFGHNAESILGIRPVGFKNYGFVEETKLRELYVLSDVFVMLSEQEAFGKTVIESLACGTPVLAMNDSGPGEVLKAVNLPTFGAELVAQFPEIVAALRKLDGNKLSNSVDTRFSISKIAHQYQELYMKLM